MSMWQDFKFAFRSLRKTPALTVIAVITIAIGIGFNAANFSIVYELLVRPLEIPDMDRVVILHEKSAQAFQYQDNMAPRTWLDAQQQTGSYEQFAGYEYEQLNLTGFGLPEQIFGADVTPEFFNTLRVPAALGRTFAADEIQGKSDHVAVLSDGLWKRRYGSDPAIVGKKVELDGESYLVAGVMPKTFAYPAAVEVWKPIMLTPAQKEGRNLRIMTGFGRLKPGVTVAQADAEIKTLAARLAKQFPDSDGGVQRRAVEMARGITEDVTRSFIWTLTFSAGFVLLIVCANIANLLLARGATRQREMAVRTALGARRGRLVRQLLTESLLLSVTSGVLALGVAAWSLDFIKAGIPPTTTRFIPGWVNMGINRPVLAFTLGLAIVTSVVFGLIPALSASGASVGDALKESGRSVLGGRHRLRSALVVVQVSLALVLLTSAGALVKGFIRASNPNRGLDPHNVLTFMVGLPESRYSTPAAKLEFQRRTLEALRALPGVEDAAVTGNIPWGNNQSDRLYTIVGRPAPRREDMPDATWIPSSPNYLALLRVPLVSGRMIEPADDRADAEQVALINRSEARRHWGGEDPIGSHIRIETTGKSYRIVGVVGDVYNHYERDAPAAIYVPSAQGPSGVFYFAVRTRGESFALADSARRAVAGVDGQMPLANVRTLEQQLKERTSGIRLGSTMMAAFAVVALLLSVIGIYGVIAYLVAQRHQEIGIRMALGAQPGQVLRMIMARGGWLVGVGVALGLPAAIFVGRLLAGALFTIIDNDASVFTVITLVVMGMALLGTLIPARRASRVDPMVALRYE
jgi:putative ABC transport system permease protein